MKHLIRRATAALFAGAMLFGVAACGDDDVDNGNDLGDELDEGGDDLGNELDEGGDELEGELGD